MTTTTYMTASQELTLYRGETKNFVLTIKLKDQFDPEGNPLYVRLTDDHDVIFTVKKTVDSEHPLFQKRLRNSGDMELVSAGGGQVRILVKTGDTLRAAQGAYKFDVWLRVISLDEQYLIVPPRNFNILMPVLHRPR